MKKKRWKVAHIVGLIIALGLVVLMAVSCAPQAQTVTAETHNVYSAPASQPAPRALAQVLEFQEQFEHAWQAQAAPPSGLPISEGAVITYIYALHILAIIGIISIFIWIF